ncbi:MAG: alpha/beta hydrolase, partial [Oxalobacteraceae bacterium]
WRTDPSAEALDLDGVRALRFAPPGGVARRGTVLHLHGGAFRIGVPEQVGPFAAALAARCDVAVVCPVYRLAPEAPFPAALHDGRTAMTALMKQGCGPLILAGDSAGGGLAASLASNAPHDPLSPVGLVLLSAWLDLTVTAPAYRHNAASDALFSIEAAGEAARLYLQGHDARDPLASPLHAGVAGFPPTFVSVGGGEVLADDARAFAALLHAAGVAVTLDEVPGMEHVAVTRDMALPGARRTFDATSVFINAILGAT